MNVRLLLLTSVLLGGAVRLDAAVNISLVGTGTASQFPGSATDYSFLGADHQFGPFGYGGGSPDLGTHPDFTLTADVGESYGGDTRYSTILTPAGNSSQTGILFGRAGNADQPIVNLTLGTGSATFNYADFNIYLMFGNANGDGQVRDTALSVKDGAVSLNSPVSESNSDLTKASYIEFNVTGASAGDTLVLGATSPAGINYIGGVSLESVADVPEPSTWAMLIGGCVVLGLALRRRLAL